MKKLIYVFLSFSLMYCQNHPENNNQAAFSPNEMSSDTINAPIGDEKSKMILHKPASVSMDELTKSLSSVLLGLKFDALGKRPTTDLSIPKLFKDENFVRSSETSEYSRGQGRKISYVIYEYSNSQQAHSTFEALAESIYLDGVFKAGGGAFLVEDEILHITSSCSLPIDVGNYLREMVSDEDIFHVVCKCGGYCEIFPAQ